MITIDAVTPETRAIKQELSAEIEAVLERHKIFITGEQAHYAAIAALLAVEMCLAVEEGD